VTAAGPARVAVLDYGSGNVHSAVKALERAGAAVTLTRDFDEVLRVDGLVVPGVGAFDAVITQLQKVGGPEMIARRLSSGRPVLGICVGEQVMFERGIERGTDTEGLGYWRGAVRELRAERLPHMGWNTVRAAAGSTLFRGIGSERFYFVHSNAATEEVLEGPSGGGPPLITWAEHGERFIAAIESGALSATQFHPEKSGDAGIRLLRNWIGSLPSIPDAQTAAPTG